MIQELSCIDASYFVIMQDTMSQSYHRREILHQVAIMQDSKYVAIIQDVMLKLKKSNAALCRDYARHYFAFTEDVMSQLWKTPFRNDRRGHVAIMS